MQRMVLKLWWKLSNSSPGMAQSLCFKIFKMKLSLKEVLLSQPRNKNFVTKQVLFSGIEKPQSFSTYVRCAYTFHRWMRGYNGMVLLNSWWFLMYKFSAEHTQWLSYSWLSEAEAARSQLPNLVVSTRWLQSLQRLQLEFKLELKVWLLFTWGRF